MPRFANAAVLADELIPYFQAQSTDYWCERFEAAGIPAGPVMNHVQALNDPQAQARNMVVEVEHSKLGKTKTLGVQVKLSETPGSVRRGAPLVGEHNDEVFTDWLDTASDAAE